MDCKVIEFSNLLKANIHKLVNQHAETQAFARTDRLEMPVSKIKLQSFQNHTLYYHFPT
uniref:Uncharacterized protein n=1 Tax=Arundo donax TaxID=35708 RepID=A0A0A9H996_ARUDO